MPLARLVLVAFLLLAPPAAAQEPGDLVTVRVEGTQGTLLTKVVELGTAPVTLTDGTCGPATAAAVLDTATGGNWDRRRTPQVILGESHDGAAGDRWAAWVSQALATADLCTQPVIAGDELLLVVDVPPGTFPLVLREVPTHMRPGRPYRVRVLEVRPAGGQPGTGELHGAEGALVRGARTNAEGYATIITSQRGPVELKAERGPTRSALVRACITDGVDGFCGSSQGQFPSFEDEPGVDDPSAPSGVRSLWTSVRDGQVFPKGGGPAYLRGIVTGPGKGVTNVRFRLTRRHEGRCFAHDPVRRRQKRLKRCTSKGGIWRELGDQARFEYLMPYTTPPGRYVLDAQVRDRAGRVSRLERGNTRVVFFVR